VNTYRLVRTPPRPPSRDRGFVPPCGRTTGATRPCRWVRAGAATDPAPAEAQLSLCGYLRPNWPCATIVWHA